MNYSIFCIKLLLYYTTVLLNVTIESINETDIKLHWIEPILIDERVAYYQVRQNDYMWNNKYVKQVDVVLMVPLIVWKTRENFGEFSNLLQISQNFFYKQELGLKLAIFCQTQFTVACYMPKLSYTKVLHYTKLNMWLDLWKPFQIAHWKLRDNQFYKDFKTL